jgi:hypothetical protein
MGTRAKSMNEIKHQLKWATGTETWFRHSLVRKSLRTEGIEMYLDIAQAYWLMDIIATEFHNQVLNKAGRTHYITLKVEGSKAVIKMTNGEGTLIYERRISYTDHVEGEIQFNFIYDGEYSVLCLPSEN